MRRMQGLLFGAIPAAALVAFASTAFAAVIGLNPSTSGSFTANCTSTTTCILSTSAGGVSGSTSTGGTYKYDGMSATLDSCTVAGGCGTLMSGSEGTLTVDGTTYNITGLVLDGDSTTLDFIFTAPGLASTGNDTTIQSPLRFDQLLTGAPDSVTGPVSSGEVTTVPMPEPASLTLLGAALVGLGWLGRRRRRTV